MSEIKLEETPTLTFEPFKEEPQLPVEEAQKQMAEAAPALDDSMLSDEEKQMEGFCSADRYCQFSPGAAVWCRCTAESSQFFRKGTGECEDERPW